MERFEGINRQDVLDEREEREAALAALGGQIEMLEEELARGPNEALEEMRRDLIAQYEQIERQEGSEGRAMTIQ